MKTFEPIDPQMLDQNPHLVASLPDDTDSSITWHFLIIDNYLIIAQAYFNPLKQKWLHDQIELPKRGLQWFLDTLRDRFFKTEAEGGLPKGQFSTSTLIDGEQLALQRAFNADLNGGGGYALVTVNRKKNGLPKEYTFTDAFLFDHGLMDVMDDIASRIRAGTL